MTKKQLPEKGSRWYCLTFGRRLEFEVTSVNEMYIGYKRLDNGKYFSATVEAWPMNLKPVFKQPAVGSLWTVQLPNRTVHVRVEKTDDPDLVKTRYADGTPGNFTRDFWAAHATPIAMGKEISSEAHDHALDAVRYAIEEISSRTAERGETNKPSAQQSNRSNTMKLIDTRTYVRGVDIKTMSEAVLLTTIESLEDEKKRIEPLVARSEALGKRTKALDDAINVLVEELASR